MRLFIPGTSHTLLAMILENYEVEEFSSRWKGEVWGYLVVAKERVKTLSDADLDRAFLEQFDVTIPENGDRGS